MLPREHKQEHLCGAYIRAVAAAAGCTCQSPLDYGVDFAIRDVDFINGRCSEAGWCIDLQAKSTHTAEVRHDHVVYDLDVKNYNDLILSGRGIPLILVLLVMPSQESEWVCQGEECIELRKCAYWMSLRARKPTDNKETIRVSIPRSQVFTPEVVRGMLDQLRAGVRP